MRTSKTLLAVLALSTVFGNPISASIKEKAEICVNDTTLTTKVKTALITNAGLVGAKIHVESIRGRVLLSGFVSSSEQKAQVEKIAKSSGATSINNGIMVHDTDEQQEETAGQHVDDTTLTTRIKAQTLKDFTLKSSQIHVESIQEKVFLSGFVDSSEQKTRAEEIAKDSGAKKVANGLMVRDSTEK